MAERRAAAARRARPLIAGACVAAVYIAVHDVATAQEITVSLKLDKDRYLNVEPIVGYVAITNGGTRPARVESRLDADLMIVRYRITDPAGREYSFVPHSVADAAHPTVELAPGESVHGYVLLHHGGTGWTFRERGTFSIRAQYLSGRFRSEPVRLTIEEPESIEDRKYCERILRTPEVGRFFMFEEGDHLTRAVDLLQEMAKQRSGSVMWRYAAYMLGSAFSKSFPDFRAGKYRAAKRPEAIRLLESVRDDLPSFYFTAKACLLLELNYSRLGDDSRAAVTRSALQGLMRERFSALEPWLEPISDHVRRGYVIDR